MLLDRYKTVDLLFTTRLVSPYQLLRLIRRKSDQTLYTCTIWKDSSYMFKELRPCQVTVLFDHGDYWAIIMVH